jgi:hypothetical protein
VNHPAGNYELDIGIGAIPIRVRTESSDFAGMLVDRYGKFAAPGKGLKPIVELDIKLERLRTAHCGDTDGDEDVTVRLQSGRWLMQRGDFRATWDANLRHGWVRQTANPYSIDCVLRILHSLILAREGGFLVHAASAVRGGQAYLFAGVSGAGKTTISRLAPPDVKVLTDEISYVRAVPDRDPKDESEDDSDQLSKSSRGTRRYVAFGTPFAGELARIGENLQAPVAALYLLVQGPENCIEPVTETTAARCLMRNILFFAEDEELVRQVFHSVFEFVRQVPVRRLVFAPTERVWELVGAKC